MRFTIGNRVIGGGVMRVRPFLLSLVLGLVMASGPAGAGMDEVPPESLGPEAVEQTWTRAFFYFPADANPIGNGVIGGQQDLGSVRLALDTLAKGAPRPVVVYLHGCGGFGNSGSTNAVMLAEAGFVVVAPDSFARPKRVRTCDSKTHSRAGPKGIYKNVIAWRLEELDRALVGLKGFSWVDWNNIFLFGHSQGSNAVASYPGSAFKGRIMSGTRCSTGYHGPAEEPALAVYSENDPWRKGRPIKCLDYVGTTGMQVLGLAGDLHVVAKDPAAKARMLEFLERLITR
ncbi:hypothetical protein KFF05_10135 [bacterium SCSIO 12827]|nr:hypothetical protein KFF05_10135 [bacterium SCSIO 12827]